MPPAQSFGFLRGAISVKGNRDLLARQVFPASQSVERLAELRDEVQIEPLVAHVTELWQVRLDGALDLAVPLPAHRGAEDVHLVFVRQQERVEHPRLVARRKGVALETGSGRGGQFHLDAAFFEQNLVEPDARALRGFVKVRAVTGVIRSRMGAQRPTAGIMPRPAIVHSWMWLKQLMNP